MLSRVSTVFSCPEPVEYEDFDGDEDAVDLRAYQVLGGTFHFNLLHMPPQPKLVNNWILTQGLLNTECEI